MKARVKATGEIVEVRYSHHSMDCPSQHYYRTPNGSTYKEESLDFNDTSDYWEKLKHRYAGQAMEAMLTNPELLEVVTEKKGLTKKEYAEKVACVADIYATALVKKLKGE